MSNPMFPPTDHVMRYDPITGCYKRVLNLTDSESILEEPLSPWDDPEHIFGPDPEGEQKDEQDIQELART